MIFFNQVLFIGLFATLVQIPSQWEFIGNKALVFLVACLTIIVAFFLIRNGKLKLAKRIFIFTIYSLGIYTTTLLGGAGLYHLGIFCTFTFGLILFDMRKEKLEILLGIPFLVLCFLLGELDWFNLPDFSNHPSIEFVRVSNLTSFVLINTILVVFFIRLNYKTEDELSHLIEEKNQLLSEIRTQTELLENNKTKLEATVLDRTAELSAQKDILYKQNDEKEILLKEVHHRVKNNLQIIVSLLNLQSNKINDVKSVEAIQETRGRVLSMALAHTKMYQSSNLKEIELLEYCHQLINDTGLIFGCQDIVYTLDIPDKIKYDMEQMIPLGLILNEIITNYFKHVWQGADKNTSFSIQFAKNNNGKQTLIYSDNGPGFIDIKALSTTNTLGIQLIDSLVEQLDGTLEFRNENGAVYAFTFKQ